MTVTFGPYLVSALAIGGIGCALLAQAALAPFRLRRAIRANTALWQHLRTTQTRVLGLVADDALIDARTELADQIQADIGALIDAQRRDVTALGIGVLSICTALVLGSASPWLSAAWVLAASIFVASDTVAAKWSNREQGDSSDTQSGP